MRSCNVPPFAPRLLPVLRQRAENRLLDKVRTERDDLALPALGQRIFLGATAGVEVSKLPQRRWQASELPLFEARDFDAGEWPLRIRRVLALWFWSICR